MVWYQSIPPRHRERTSYPIRICTIGKPNGLSKEPGPNGPGFEPTVHTMDTALRKGPWPRHEQREGLEITKAHHLTQIFTKNLILRDSTRN